MGDVIGALELQAGQRAGDGAEGRQPGGAGLVPLAEMATYASELRSLTGGRGSYGMRFSHYQEVPAHLQQGVVEAAKKEKEKHQ